MFIYLNKIKIIVNFKNNFFGNSIYIDDIWVED